MGIDTFHLNLNAPPYQIYRPGDLVTGTVKLIASPDADLSEGITIRIYGNVKVQWHEHRGSTTVTYNGNESIFETSLVLSCSHGQTDYQFSLQIPTIPALPWTTATQHGQVEYGVKAEIKRPWYKLGSKKTEMNITINSPLNSRIASSSKNYQLYADNKITSKEDLSKVGFCCFPFCCWYLLSPEKVKMILTTQSLWAYPGEELPFTLEVDNSNTRRELRNAKVQLIGTWTHKGHCNPLIHKGHLVEKTSEMVFQEEFVQMCLSPGDQVIKKGILKVPMDAIPTQVECSILTLTYKLKGVIDEISGATCIKMPVSVEIDVLVGTLGANDVTTIF